MALSKIRLRQANPVSFFDKLTDFREKGNTVDLINLDLSQPFDTI